jgi:hypothetical protein
VQFIGRAREAQVAGSYLEGLETVERKRSLHAEMA